MAGDDGDDGGASLGHWDNLPPMPAPLRFYVGVAAVGNQVFVIGGQNTTAPALDTVQVFDVDAQTWQTLSPLPSPIGMPNVAVVGDRLFILGGRQNQATLEYVGQGQWLEHKAMPLANGRGAAAVGVWGTKVVIAGGIIPGLSNNMLDTGVRQIDVVAYDTATDTWQTLASMTDARGYSMGAVVGDKFWVIGGSTNNARTPRVQTLDLTTNTWADDPSLSVSLSSAGVGLVNGHMYLIGGILSASGVISPNTLEYDFASGMANPLATMLAPRFALGAAPLGGRIYAAGGIAMSSATDFAPVGTFDVFTP
jgi:hypothetical protein